MREEILGRPLETRRPDLKLWDSAAMVSHPLS